MATKALTWRENRNELRRRKVHRLLLGKKTVALVGARPTGWEAQGIESGVFTWTAKGRDLEQVKQTAMAWARRTYNVEEMGQ